jgi:predicted transposase YbfD/YdcC
MLTSRNPEKMTAADLNRHTRNHWGIENKNHYATPHIARTTARHGQEKGPIPSRHSATSQSGSSG